MHRIRHEDLPFVGSSHQFVGARQGNTNVSVFLFNGKPGSGPGPHRHPYDEIQFIQSGRGRWTVSGETFEAGAGDIFVIKAGEVHAFQALGPDPLVQLDIHLSPVFIQENLGELPASTFTRFWRFTPAPGAEAEFARMYGGDGDWVALFQQARGYLGTELRPLGDGSGDYLTLDRWESADAWQAFREAHGAAYDALDARCEGLTVRETLLGELSG